MAMSRLFPHDSSQVSLGWVSSGEPRDNRRRWSDSRVGLSHKAFSGSCCRPISPAFADAGPISTCAFRICWVDRLPRSQGSPREVLGFLHRGSGLCLRSPWKPNQKRRSGCALRENIEFEHPNASFAALVGRESCEIPKPVALANVSVGAGKSRKVSELEPNICCLVP